MTFTSSSATSDFQEHLQMAKSPRPRAPGAPVGSTSPAASGSGAGAWPRRRLPNPSPPRGSRPGAQGHREAHGPQVPAGGAPQLRRGHLHLGALEAPQPCPAAREAQEPCGLRPTGGPHLAKQVGTPLGPRRPEGLAAAAREPLQPVPRQSTQQKEREGDRGNLNDTCVINFQKSFRISTPSEDRRVGSCRSQPE